MRPRCEISLEKGCSSSFLICKIGSRWLTLEQQKSCQPCGFADSGKVFESPLRYVWRPVCNDSFLACRVSFCISGIFDEICINCIKMYLNFFRVSSPPGESPLRITGQKPTRRHLRDSGKISMERHIYAVVIMKGCFGNPGAR